MSKKRSGSQKRQSRPTMAEIQRDVMAEPRHHVKHKKAPPLSAKSEMQGLYISTILHHDITFGLGPAGTGKTYVSTVMACEALEVGEIEKIVLTRPAVDTESFGALPGELDEKYAPYIAPFEDIFIKQFGKGKYEYLLKSKKIVAEPLAFMRGKTYENAWVLLDEAQNTTVTQMKMALTRIGEGSKMIISGDMAQNDLPRHIPSGLNDAVERLEKLPEIGITTFEKEDVVRHGLISKILTQYGE